MTHESLFQPDWISPPGETIADVLRERNIPLSEFAKLVQESQSHVRDLINGAARITPELAKRLAVAIGGTQSFWINREIQYRELLHKAQQRLSPSQQNEWLQQLPVSDMVNFGWIHPSNEGLDKATACLRFFGVADINAWTKTYNTVLDHARFRTSTTFKSDPIAVAVWLRQAELEASSIECKPWNASSFRTQLEEIRSLSRQDDPETFLPALRDLCADCGVAVVVVRAPSGCRASGAVRVLPRERRMIALSFRHLTDDHFWFTFFHEAGHLLLHSGEHLIYDPEEGVADKKEQEANQFAAETLVPTNRHAEMLTLPSNGIKVMRFARSIGISPGIVVGQLQHFHKLRRNQLNNLKRRYTWE